MPQDSDSTVTSPAAAPAPEGVAVTALAPSLAAGEGGWPTWQRYAFRYALLHYTLYAFPGPIRSLIGTLFGLARLLGLDIRHAPWTWLGASFAWVGQFWQWLTLKLAALGVAPYEVIHQPTGSGDTGAAYAKLLAIVALSLLGTLIWSLVDRSRAYPRLARWLHLIVRVDVAFALFGYGFAKFYGGQFGELTLYRLTQEIGDTSPMGMVGTFMQASKPYELFGGACEVLGGFLLFHRRTALLGACVSIATMANICALNWLYGVPVKLYSTHLLFFSVGLLAPFLPQLWAVFIRNRPSQPVDLRVIASPWPSRVILALGVVWVGVYLVQTHVQGIKPKFWEKEPRTALYGLWTVESMTLDGKTVPMTDGTRWRDFAIDRGLQAWSREFNGRRHFFDFRWDAPTGIAHVKERNGGGDAEPWTVERGTQTVKGPRPLVLRSADRGQSVDVERRSLVLKGKWNGHELELKTVEKVFRIQTGFRLRQELPDGW